MRKIPLLFAAIFYFSLLAFSTAQEPDRIIYNGDILLLHANPLALRPDFDTIDRKMFGGDKPCVSTGCWDGYVAEWAVINNQLYLTNIYACCSDDIISENLNELFGSEYKNGMVFADWVSGRLVAPSGECIEYVHSGYSSIYEKETILRFWNGELIGSQEIINENYAHNPTISNNPDTLKDYISRNIRSDLILNNKDTLKLYFLIMSGDFAGSPSDVRLLKSKSSSLNSESQLLLKEELVQILYSIPDWDVYTIGGKVRKKVKVISITFTPEQLIDVKIKNHD